MEIRFENLSKIYPSRKAGTPGVAAVDHFNFTIPSGKLVGLLGPSGCGKSTTLNLICGLESATEGKIFFDDRDVTKLQPENRGVGMVFQNYALYPHMTAQENIKFPLGNLKGKNKLSEEEKNARALKAAKLVQIERLLDRKPGEMSGGQQQRVAIARALVKTPDVLLLDEPLSNLDARLRLQTREEIRRIQLETGVTTVFVTHDQEEAMSISDFIVVMSAGKVQQIGKPQDVYNAPNNLFVAKFLGTPAINVFKGEVKDGGLYIGEEKVLSLKNVANQLVTVGIRPEGFVLDADGPFHTKLNNYEEMGRDTSVVSTHPSFEGRFIRSIVPSDEKITEKDGFVSFSLKPNKVHIFSAETEERIPFEV